MDKAKLIIVPGTLLLFGALFFWLGHPFAGGACVVGGICAVKY